MSATAAALTFADGLTKKFAHLEPFPPAFEVREGKINDKIVKTGPHGGSVHAFVDRATGHVYKAAGAARRAEGARYANVEDALAAADPYGGYLYAGAAPGV